MITNEKVTPEYLSYYFKFSNFDMSNLTNNSGVKHINLSILKNIQIPVPPLAEQEKIVAEVNTIEEKIAELEALMAQANDKKKAILQKYL
nr:restriction endonuclease subunit S [Ornithobacterium rhinotracheale]